MTISNKLIGGAAVGATLLFALPALAQTTTDTTASSTGTTTGTVTDTSVGTPNTGAGGDLMVNLTILGTSALAAVAGGVYLARARAAH